MLFVLSLKPFSVSSPPLSMTSLSFEDLHDDVLSLCIITVGRKRVPKIGERDFAAHPLALARDLLALELVSKRMYSPSLRLSEVINLYY